MTSSVLPTNTASPTGISTASLEKIHSESSDHLDSSMDAPAQMKQVIDGIYDSCANYFSKQCLNMTHIYHFTIMQFIIKVQKFNSK